MTEIVLPENNDQLIYKQQDVDRLGISARYADLRAKFYRADERGDCVLLQGAAFVVRGKAFPMLGVGGIDFLDSLATNPEVDGIIGNGNALFVAHDFSHIYSAHTKDELVRCYEYEVNNPEVNDPVDKFLDDAPMAPLIFLFRSTPPSDEKEYTRIRTIKQDNILFEVDKTFATTTIPFNSHRWKNELRDKFLRTTRVVHCARRPTMEAKECLFDSRADIKAAVDNFQGQFALIYTMWSQTLCEARGMKKTRACAPEGLRNPTDRITPHLLEMAKRSLDS